MKIKHLSNGVRVVVVPLKGLKAVTIEVFVKIGSKYEKAGEHGLSHFLEHMAFKGTDKRASAEVVNREIDAKGASYNAGTGQENTSYYIKTVKENLEWGLEMLSDIVLNPKIEVKEVIKERGVIVEELRMYSDNPAMGLSEDFYDFMFGESKIGCWDVGGKVAEVAKYNRREVVGYRQKYLNPEKMVVVVAGDVENTEAVEKMIEKYFGSYVNVKSIDLPKVEVIVTKKDHFERIKEVEQGHFCVGVEGIRRNDERRYDLKVLEVIMAGNTSSRLFNEIREKRGWGLVGVQSGVKADKLEKAMELTVSEMIKMAYLITDEEMTRAKSFIRGKTGLAMDKSDFWSQFVGDRVLLDNELSTPEEELKQIDKVGVKEVKQLAAELFVPGRIKRMWVKAKKD
ncbi:MAG: pitrilysin family protein [Candidatus Shapirobacteria bacterium]|nr:pitrilysin family protein [Candidatus Shapirobacteria bacterium]